MQPHAPALKKIATQERQRSNWLMLHERSTIAWLCPRMPWWLTSNMLTGLGVIGSAMLAAAMILGRSDRWWLLAGILGLAVNWFGDSLDGRLAYFRKRPRKWYGFVLDLMMDWTSLCLIVAGSAYYLPKFKFIPVAFMAVYGARMLIAALGYKITEEYRIDSGQVGPTEVRLLVAAALLLEIFIPGTLLGLGVLASAALFCVDIFEFRKLLKCADARDYRERSAAKQALPAMRSAQHRALDLVSAE